MHSLIAISNSQDLIAYGYGLLWPQVISELVIALSYYAILLSLAYFICQRKDFPCPWLIKLFAGFTVAYGITQMLGGFSNLKIFTAFIAIVTVLLVFWLIRQTLTSSHPAQLKTETAQSKQKVIEYQTFIKYASNGFWCCDTNGKLLDVNDALCNMLGYSEQELLTMSIMDIEAIETTEETVARIQHIMKTGHGCFETQHRRKDGRIIDVEIDTCFLTALESRFFVFITDISHRKQAEQEKRVNEDRLRTFYQLDLVGLSITSPEKG